MGKNLGERGRRERGRRDEIDNQLQKGRLPRRRCHQLRRKRRGEFASSSSLSSSREDDNVGQREGQIVVVEGRGKRLGGKGGKGTTKVMIARE